MIPVNYYNKLAESLEKKHLQEAWSESMPDWMKPRMDATAMYSDDHTNTKIARHAGLGKFEPWYGSTESNQLYNIRSKKGQGRYYDPVDYASTRNDSRVGENIFNAFKRAGIDLQKVEFIEGPVPTSKSDPRIQPPNIGIWNIPSTGQLYAKGINDLEKLLGGSGTKYDGYRFEHLPLKALQELSDHFCYIEGSNIPMRDYDAVTKERYAWQREVSNNAPLYTNRDRADVFINYDNLPDMMDKSGYIVIPSSRRYAKELKARHGRKYAEKLEALENDLNSLKADIMSAMNRLPMDDYSRIGAITGALEMYKNALHGYGQVLDQIDNAIQYYGENSDEFFSNMANVFDPNRPYSYYKNTQNYIDAARNKIKQYSGTVLDF